MVNTMIAADQRGSLVILEDKDRQSLTALAAVLASTGEKEPAVLSVDGGHVPIPEGIRQLLQTATQLLLAGQAVDIVSLPAEVTIEEAAKLLGERSEDIQALVTRGQIPSIDATTPVRMRLADVVAFHRAERAQRRQALDELVQLSQDMGGYAASS